MQNKELTKEEIEQHNKLIQARVITLSYEPPKYSFMFGVHGVCTTISLFDLIYIYKQIHNQNIKNQIKQFIMIMDKQQNVYTDIEKIELPRKYKEDGNKRCIIEYKNSIKEI